MSVLTRLAPKTIAWGIILLPVGAAPAWGASMPVYAHAEVVAEDNGSGGTTDVGTGDGATSASASAGTLPGGFIVIGPGEALVGGQISSNAVAGSASAEAEVLTNGVVPPPFQKAAEAVVWTYLRSTWQVVATNSGLGTGDPVDVLLSADLGGDFDLASGANQGGQARLAYMLNQSADAFWLGPSFPEFLTPTNWDDIQGTYGATMPISVNYLLPAPSSTGGPIDFQDSQSAQVAVGDTIVLETLFVLRLTDGGGVGTGGWGRADFTQTLATSFAATTAGAALVLVPEPGAALLVAAGLAALAAARRARRGRTR